MRNPVHDQEVKVRLCQDDDEFLAVLAKRMQLRKAELARILIAQALKRVSMPPSLSDGQTNRRPG